MQWLRATKWRQGSVLPSKSFAVLSLPKSADITLALAISHDCDIANDNLDAEPTVEFVLGRVVDKSNGNYGFGKNHRVLHLPATLEGKPATLELLAIRKISIHKEDLATHEPDERFVLEMKPRQILQSWLAARYRRQALPDRLVARLRPVFDFLEKQGKKHALGILGYWFDFDPHDVELPPDQSYELWLNIVYSIDNPAIEEDAKNLAASVREKFHELMKVTADLGTVDLRHCEAYSEQEFTLSDLRNNIEYRLEYLSHRINAPGPIV